MPLTEDIAQQLIEQHGVTSPDSESYQAMLGAAEVHICEGTLMQRQEAFRLLYRTAKAQNALVATE